MTAKLKDIVRTAIHGSEKFSVAAVSPVLNEIGESLKEAFAEEGLDPARIYGIGYEWTANPEKNTPLLRAYIVVYPNGLPTATIIADPNEKRLELYDGGGDPYQHDVKSFLKDKETRKPLETASFDDPGKIMPAIISRIIGNLKSATIEHAISLPGPQA